MCGMSYPVRMPDRSWVGTGAGVRPGTVFGGGDPTIFHDPAPRRRSPASAPRRHLGTKSCRQPSRRVMCAYARNTTPTVRFRAARGMVRVGDSAPEPPARAVRLPRRNIGPTLIAPAVLHTAFSPSPPHVRLLIASATTPSYRRRVAVAPEPTCTLCGASVYPVSRVLCSTG
jgi:hypothetical protein